MSAKQLSGRESIELTIRAANAAKSILELIGVKDCLLAKLLVADSNRELKEIAKLIEETTDGD